MTTYRTGGPWGSGKGADLTAAEVDANFYGLAQAVADIAAAAPAGVGITNITALGSQMTIYLSDETSHTITMPRTALRYRSDWAAATVYSVNDFFVVAGVGLYIVTTSHTSAAAPFAETSAVEMMMPLVSGALPTLAGNAGKVLAVNTGETAAEWIEPGGGGAVAVKDEGVEVVAAASTLNFTGEGVTVLSDGASAVTIEIGAGGVYTPPERPYWRLEWTGFNGTDGRVFLSEIYIEDAEGARYVANPTASAVSGSSTVDKAFDSNLTNSYGSASLTGGTQWIQINPVTVLITRIRLLPEVDLYAEYAPTGFKVLKSANGTDWELAWEVTGITWPTAAEQTFDDPDPPLVLGAYYTQEAPKDGGAYARQNGVWVDTRHKTVKTVAGTYDFKAEDDGGVIISSGGSLASFRIPLKATHDFAIGTEFTVIQGFTGQVQLQALDGFVGFKSAYPTWKTRAQNSVIKVLKTEADFWFIYGDVATS